MIDITQAAIDQIKSVSSDAETEPIIRAGVKGGGCAGYFFVLEFEKEENIRETDNVIEKDKVKIVVDMMSLNYLENTTIDYINGLMASGFKFISNEKRRTCGCGQSFSA